MKQLYGFDKIKKNEKLKKKVKKKKIHVVGSAQTFSRRFHRFNWK